MTVNLKEKYQQLSQLEEKVAQDLYQAYQTKSPLQMADYEEAVKTERSGLSCTKTRYGTEK
ncbi:hypothetical protein FC86_GL000525 [Holzapfeliella floricola DSM 23037 = JCM 16512]|uniref:Uncharacterized protein n=1 Tax=Holzapfeliella floricola DSM 23037 = JCM 16512 TaxID=1423744 RepID=A0A0R2DUV9_9LACO|nr:hypothetical protein FC86_GL000525 [Holzapfeliella floricola DSM 23037 = JCM 16512]